MAKAPYQPPVMPPYPATRDELSVALATYMQERRPGDLFLEFLVVDVLGELPPSTMSALEDLGAERPIFGPSGDWRSHVRKIFSLSDTFDVAILDLWFRNSDIARAAGWTYHPWHFAKNFIEEYFAEGSKVDVWQGNALETARARIASRRQAG